MKKIVPVLLLLTPLTLLANGGPIASSPVFGTGDAGPEQFIQRDIELVSEEITLSPRTDFVEVDVTYVLRNDGADLITGYCFPVTVSACLKDTWYTDDFSAETDVPIFSISLNGTELPVETVEGEPAEPVVEEYGFYEIPVTEYLYLTDLHLPAGTTSTIQVSYTVRSTYEDFHTTKNFFASFADRRFAYDLSPAGWWGDGTVDDFTLTIDVEELHILKGSVVEIPEGGDWVEDDRYVIAENDLDLLSAEPVLLSWESRTSARSVWISDRWLSPEHYSVTASSQLGESYSPEKMVDDDLSTAWCEGAEGTTGEWIELCFNEGVYVDWVGIVPGYAKTEHTYTANARPLEVTVVTVVNGSSDYGFQVETAPIPWDPHFIQPYIAEICRDVYNRGESYQVESIRITFDETIPGTLYEDLCISEIFVAGWTDR